MAVNLPLIFLLLFLAFGLANFTISVLILRHLTRSGVPVLFFEIRWQIHRHLKTYRELTRKETGKVAPLYYGYWITLGGLLSSAVLALAALPAH